MKLFFFHTMRSVLKHRIFFRFNHIKYSILDQFFDSFSRTFSTYLFLMEKLCLFNYIYLLSHIFIIVTNYIYLNFSIEFKTFIIKFIDRTYRFCFVLYSIRRIYMWFTTIYISIMAFIISKISIMKDIITIYWFFWACLISRKKWFKKFSNNFICFMINYCF